MTETPTPLTPPPDFSQPQIRQLLPLQIAILHGKLNAQARKLLAQVSDLSLPEWRVLRLLGLGISHSSATLRKTALIDKGQFSRILSRLIERNLVVADANPSDKRQWDLELTALGHETYAAIAPALDKRQAHLSAALTPEQLKVLMIAIDQLGGAAEDDITFDGTETDNA